MTNQLALHALLDKADNVKLDGITVKVEDYKDNRRLSYQDAAGFEVECFTLDEKVVLANDGTIQITTFDTVDDKEGVPSLLTLSMLRPMTSADL